MKADRFCLKFEPLRWRNESFCVNSFFGRHRKTSRNNPHRNVVLTRLYSRWHVHSQNPCRCGSLKTSLRLRFWIQNSKIESPSVHRRKLKTAKKLLVRQKDESNYIIDRQLEDLSHAYQASLLETCSCLRIWKSSSLTAQWNEVFAAVSLTTQIHASFSIKVQ